MNRIKELKANIKTVRQQNKVLKKTKQNLISQINQLKIIVTKYHNWKDSKIITRLFKNYYLVKVKDEHSTALP